MNREDALQTMMQNKSDHEKLFNVWNKFRNLVNEMLSLKEELVGTKIPEIHNEKSGYRIYFYFTDMPLFIEFMQKSCVKGCLHFAYQKKDDQNNYLDVITDEIFFDLHGNVYKKDGSVDGTSIIHETAYSDAFLPRLYKTLEKSLNYEQ